MTTCVSNMLSLVSSSYQCRRARAEAEERVLVRAGGRSSRSILFFEGRLNLRPTSFEVAALRGSVGLPILSIRRKRTGPRVSAAFVCSAGASGGPPDSQSSEDAPKPKQGVNLLPKLVLFYFSCAFSCTSESGVFLRTCYVEHIIVDNRKGHRIISVYV